MRSWLLICAVVLSVSAGLGLADAQEIRWLRVGTLQSFVNDIGAEYEGEMTTGNNNFFSWPAQYSIDQNTQRWHALWIGCKNFNDPVENKLKSVKVISSGPRDFADRPNQIFEQEIRLIGRGYHPIVTVDDQSASALDAYDQLDEVDENLPCDRMVLVRFNTSIGISVTKKVMAFANSEHGDYFINDYVFKNTGIVNRAGTVVPQTLDSVWFYFSYRFSFAGVSSSGWGSTWGAFSSCWGGSTLNHGFGQDLSNPEFTYAGSPLRGFFSWYGPHPESNNSTLTYAQDWGCPFYFGGGDGTLGSAKYAGCLTLHADAGSQNQADDPYQPRTTWYMNPDMQAMVAGSASQYNEVSMAERYAIMSEGHPTLQHDEVVGDGNYPTNYSDPRRGPAEGQGYGPYSLAPGDSIHIVFAEGVSGISWEKGREVGANWLQYKNGTGQPTLTLPDGSTTTDQNLYKRRWVETGKDSILKAFHNAIDNYNAGYNLPQPPPAPESFTVTSGGDRIQLAWASNATGAPHFNGYVIYRSEGNVLDYRTVYQKIFECNASNVVHAFDDVTAKRGFDYYYYIQSKDDGTQVPGTVLYSSQFWTVTSEPATLQRPAVTTTLDSVRVVPNPFDIRARFLQFGDQSQYDRIAFYGLPPVCNLKVFTERGDLIWEKDHTRGTGDELWDSQTSSGQIIASGVYILYVSTPDNRSVIRKFVVIR